MSGGSRGFGRRSAGRALALVLLAGTVGAGIVLLAVSRPWAHATFAPAAPLPASSVAVTGHDLAPAGSALGLAALASVAAVLATRGIARRCCGVVLSLLGAVAAATAAAGARGAHVAAVAAAHALPGAGPPHLTAAGFPWWAAATAGGVLTAAAGAAVTWRGGRWPGMSSRYDRPPGPVATPASRSAAAGGPRSPGTGDQAATWDDLDRGIDPTVPRPEA